MPDGHPGVGAVDCWCISLLVLSQTGTYADGLVRSIGGKYSGSIISFRFLGKYFVFSDHGKKKIQFAEHDMLTVYIGISSWHPCGRLLPNLSALSKGQPFQHSSWDFGACGLIISWSHACKKYQLSGNTDSCLMGDRRAGTKVPFFFRTSMEMMVNLP